MLCHRVFAPIIISHPLLYVGATLGKAFPSNISVSCRTRWLAVAGQGTLGPRAIRDAELAHGLEWKRMSKAKKNRAEIAVVGAGAEPQDVLQLFHAPVREWIEAVFPSITSPQHNGE